MLNLFTLQEWASALNSLDRRGHIQHTGEPAGTANEPWPNSQSPNSINWLSLPNEPLRVHRWSGNLLEVLKAMKVDTVSHPGKAERTVSGVSVYLRYAALW